MEAIILCAGKGTRLSKHINNKQKCMLEVEGKPIIAHTYEHFISLGIDTIYFIVGHNHEEVTDYFSRLQTTANLEFILDKNINSTANTLLLAENYVSSEFIYSHGEIYYKRSLIEKLIETALGKRQGILSLSTDLSIAPTHPRVSVIEDTIRNFDLYPTKQRKEFPLCYMGVAKLKKDVFDYLRISPRISDSFDQMISNGEELGYVLYNDGWIHLATKEDLDKYVLNMRKDTDD